MSQDEALHQILTQLVDFSATGSLFAVSDARKGIRTLLLNALRNESDHWERMALHLWAILMHLQRTQLEQEENNEG